MNPARHMAAGAAFAQSDQPTIPAGPYGDNDSLSALRSYDQGEAIVDGYVEAPEHDLDDHHLGN